MRSNLRAPKLVDVEVLPFAERRLLFSEKRSIDDYVIFLRSLLEQLDWAHKLGVNCQDLNPYTNCYVRPCDGGAVLFDWKGYTKVGEHAYHPSRSLNMCPPEGMAQRLGASDMLMYAAHVCCSCRRCLASWFVVGAYSLLSLCLGDQTLPRGRGIVETDNLGNWR